MSICEDVVDSQSFNVLQCLVANYVFNKSLSTRFVMSRTFIDVCNNFSLYIFPCMYKMFYHIIVVVSFLLTSIMNVEYVEILSTYVLDKICWIL